MMQVDAPIVSAPAAPSIFDTFWDYGPRDNVDQQLRALFSRQLRRACQARAYRDRIPTELARASITLTRSQIESIPLLTKRDLRVLAPDDLLVDPDQPFHLVRATGGTTGTPTPVFWTRNDWHALVQASQRFCAPIQDLPRLRVWNGYNQAHVSGPAFDGLVRALGGTPIPRHYGSSDRHALEEIARMRANGIVITPQSGSGKGGSLEDLLGEDPTFIARLGIKVMIVSSTPLQPDVMEEVREQGVVFMVNFYGSTEAPPAAASCPIDPTTFHLSQAHVLVEVVGPDGSHVRSGERGAVVVSRIASASGSGVRAAEATQLIRYAIGDAALYVDEPCGCGRTSPRIRDVMRVANVEEKLAGGCERWE
jgi:phenylacetate-CoA ligase